MEFEKEMDPVEGFEFLNSFFSLYFFESAHVVLRNHVIFFFVVRQCFNSVKLSFLLNSIHV